MKLLIVGGVAGGASAAVRARRLSEESHIVLFERGPEVSFANCGLPYFIGGDIADRAKLLITTPERLHARFNLDVRTNSSVEAIDRSAKTVRVRNLKTGGEYFENYDKLILAPGAAPVTPKIAGVDLPGVFTLRSLHDADRIKDSVDQGIRRTVLVGAGFINLELTEALLRRGVTATLVEKSRQILPPFDEEMTSPVVEHLRTKGVSIRLGETVESIEKLAEGLAVVLSSGERLPAELVLIGIGVRPESRLAVDAGLNVGPRGGIQVDDYLRTSDPEIYAVGDAVEVIDAVSLAPQIPLAGPANRQGRIAADNVFGGCKKYRGTQGTAIVGFFDCIAALTGASEKSLKSRGAEYRKIYIHPMHHASYYPGAQGMALKLLFRPDGKILGAQAVGGAGVDKRIDVLAVAIHAGMSVYDLEEMELAYAPQFGSAKDPINMAGFVASGLLRGDHPQIDLERALDPPADEDGLLLDVRTPQEYASGHIGNAHNIPVDELRSRLHELPRDKRLLAYCQVGQRGYIATRILRQAGYDAVNIGGGFKTYKLWQGLRD